jgi:aspartyl-tRNA(Asn)/glutamyl-tRNA(Gln) amidotransferase subunit A
MLLKSMNILSLTMWELRELLEGKEVSCVETVKALLSEIEKKDTELHSYLHINNNLLAEAKEVDDKISKGEKIGPLGGVPIAVKDNICVRGMPATCASRMLENFYPPYDATVIEKLKEAGALILGKTNMDEFAFGSSTESSAFGPTRNPYDPQCVPGGSSGGSAAAVGANLCYGALGSDTGGSIRQPAAFCGVVGLKPTYGRVSRYGLIAFASSLDQIGPITKDVRDASIMLNILAGRDEKDSTSVDIHPPDYTDFLKEGIKGMRIGIPEEYFTTGIDDMVKTSVMEVIKKLEGLGAEIKTVSLPHTKYGIAVYYILATAEASSNLARFDGVKYGYRTPNYSNLQEMYMRTRGEGFGKEVKRRIIMGTYILSSGYYEAYYIKAQKVKTLIKKDFIDAFREVDVLVTPTTPEVPFKLGEKKEDPLKMYLSDIFTANVNLAGLPAMALPVGKAASPPVGIQIISPLFREEKIIEVAYTIEQSLKS